MKLEQLRKYCEDNQGDLSEIIIGQHPISGEPITAETLFKLLEQQRPLLEPNLPTSDEMMEEGLKYYNGDDEGFQGFMIACSWLGGYDINTLEK